MHAGTGNELFDLCPALSAKRAGEIGFASFAAALLSGADVTVELFLKADDAQAGHANQDQGPARREGARCSRRRARPAVRSWPRTTASCGPRPTPAAHAH